MLKVKAIFETDFKTEDPNKKVHDLNNIKMTIVEKDTNREIWSTILKTNKDEEGKTKLHVSDFMSFTFWDDEYFGPMKISSLKSTQNVPIFFINNEEYSRLNSLIQILKATLCGMGFKEHSTLDIAKFPCEDEDVSSIVLRLYSGNEPSLYSKYGFIIDEASKKFITPKLEKFRVITVASIFDSIALLIVGGVINRDQTIEKILQICKENKDKTLPYLTKVIYAQDCKLFNKFRTLMFDYNISDARGIENSAIYIYREPMQNTQLCL